jgi:hypothetical protein
MKRNYFVFCLLALFGSLNMQAYDFEVGGIYYTAADTATASAKAVVTAGDEVYEGSVAIPASVVYEGKEYAVVAIDAKAFYFCKGLTAVTIPQTVTKIGAEAFRNCSALTTLTLPSSVTSIGCSAFFGCSGLTSFTIPAGVTTIEPYTFYGCKRVPSFNLGGIRKIGGSAFAGCDALTSVAIPAQTTIESYCFQNCKGLTSVVIPAGVLNVGDGAFEGCTGLTSVTIPEGVVQLGRGAFEGCTGLTAITVPSTVKSLVSSTFGGCTKLTSLAVAAGNPVYDSRNNCNAIIETYVEKKKDETITHLKLVAGCKTSVIPEGVTEIGINAFLNCTGLTSINIPESVTSLGVSAFQNTGITTITIPETITVIDDFCFANCASLTTVTLPATVTKLCSDAFAFCTALKDFYCLAEKAPTTLSDVFLGTDLANATLYVPGESYGSYSLVEPWSLFGTIVPGNGNLVAPEKDAETAIASLKDAGKIQQVYSLGGQQTSKLQRGINVVRMSDGTTRKVLVK